MEGYLNYIIPVLAMAVLAAFWAGTQMLAKKMNVKNHIDNTSGCCGACNSNESCSEKSRLKTK